mgnify:CR=1 FL=1
MAAGGLSDPVLGGEADPTRADVDALGAAADGAMSATLVEDAALAVDADGLDRDLTLDPPCRSREVGRHVRELFDWIEGKLPAILDARGRQGGPAAPQPSSRPKKRIVRS